MHRKRGSAGAAHKGRRCCNPVRAQSKAVCARRPLLRRRRRCRPLGSAASAKPCAEFNPLAQSAAGRRLNSLARLESMSLASAALALADVTQFGGGGGGCGGCGVEATIARQDLRNELRRAQRGRRRVGVQRRRSRVFHPSHLSSPRLCPFHRDSLRGQPLRKPIAHLIHIQVNSPIAIAGTRRRLVSQRVT